MNNTWDIIVSVIVELTRLLVLRNFMRTLHENRKYPMGVCVGIYSITYVLAFVTYIMFHNAIVNLSVTLLGYIAISFLYKSRVAKRIISSVILLALSCVIDIFAAYVVSTNPTSNNHELISSFLSVFIFFLTAIIARYFFKRESVHFAPVMWVYALILSIACIGIMFAMALDSIASQRTVLAFSTGLFLVIFVVYNLLLESSEKALYERENNHLKNQMEKYELEIEGNIRREEDLRIMRHDLKHHLHEISYLIGHDETAKAKEYINVLLNEANDTKKQVNSGVAAIDGVLSYMLGLAEEKHIATSTHVVVPETLNLPIYDMNIIIGNLMENAIEATESHENALIDVTIRFNQQCLFIIIKNSYEGQMNQTPDVNCTSKPDKQNHGLGIKSVTKIIEKHNGAIYFSIEEDLFVVKATMMIE